MRFSWGTQNLSRWNVPLSRHLWGRGSNPVYNVCSHDWQKHPQTHFPLLLGLTLGHRNSWGLGVEKGISGEVLPLEEKSIRVTQANRRGAAFIKVWRIVFSTSINDKHTLLFDQLKYFSIGSWACKNVVGILLAIYYVYYLHANDLFIGEWTVKYIYI